jgi:hypothetical protein
MTMNISVISTTSDNVHQSLRTFEWTNMCTSPTKRVLVTFFDFCHFDNDFDIQ